MEKSYFKIPIALSKETNSVVNVKDVQNGASCNCYCPICKEDLMAVNREVKQKAHFRHMSLNDCNIVGETYIHWLTKEVFKQIKSINVPAISTLDIQTNVTIQENFLNDLEDYFKNYNLSKLLPPPITFINSKYILQPQFELLIESCTSEVRYETPFGNTRIDIVVIASGKEFFIEPFFTNKIKEDKLKKLAFLDVSTITINLMSFIKLTNWKFTVNEFKQFLTDEINSKTWGYIRNLKMDGLIQSFLNKLHNKFKAINAIEVENKKIQSEIFEIEEKISKLHFQKNILHKKIKNIDLLKFLNG